MGLARPWATLLLVVAGVGGVLAPVHADDHQAIPGPSQDEVNAAEATVEVRAEAVGRIRADLALANQRLEAASIAAEQAAEAANGARWQLALAEQAVDRARANAVRARREVARQRDHIGALVAQTYQQGDELTALSAMMGADGPVGVLDHYATFQGAASSMQADYQRFEAAEALAEVFARQAAAAERHQLGVARRAQEAQSHAAAAATAAQDAAGQIAAEKDRLIRELAEAQDISVELARQRQTALEELARQRAEERARREAAALARAEARARAEAEAEAKARAEAEARAEAAAQADDPPAPQDAPAGAPSSRPTQAPAPAAPAAPASPAPPAPQSPAAPAPSPAVAPTPAANPAPAPPPASPGGVGAALAFAREQIGEPYRWGASGPTSWDCSGLTMAAWAAGGVALPHYSVAQYAESTPVSAGELRPGDLVFWSSSSSPQGIHHVALYAGGGMIVHAPRTGRPVVEESMYAWIPPTHFARP